ncbi:hypothetical protein [Ralstonia syzygii]|uniref:Uncharacterized protein n=1 Tax=Ralstonia syzygii R24 TaxID=907261 RepID=G3A245_9RALS|nr:hypothetical protein [Ralstonia syzygii]CCA85477.1 hypothetical protein RALSY_20073 [Ralstonia syzygii R24]
MAIRPGKIVVAEGENMPATTNTIFVQAGNDSAAQADDGYITAIAGLSVTFSSTCGRKFSVRAFFVIGSITPRNPSCAEMTTIRRGPQQIRQHGLLTHEARAHPARHGPPAAPTD